MNARSLAARVLCGVVSASLCACAREPVAAPPASALDARSTARAAELAPDLYGRSLQARREAATASGKEARDSASARAELWLQAAVVEAARIDAQRAAATAEARTLAAESHRVAAQREREQLERDQALAEAGRSAHARAERMLAGGALAEAARHGDDAALAEATSFALERASLLLSTVRALGLGEPGAAALGARLDALAAKPDSRLRLRSSLELLEALERALGEARLARPGPSAQERDSLHADAAERGLALDLQPARARLSFDARAFAPGRADLSAEGVLALANLAALLRLHPRGAHELEPGGSALAARRAGVLAARLRAMRTDIHIAPVPPERPSTGVSADTVSLWLLAYGTAGVAQPRAITTP